MNKHVSDYLKKCGITTIESLITGSIAGLGTYKAMKIAEEKDEEYYNSVVAAYEADPDDEDIKAAYEKRFDSNYIIKVGLICYAVAIGLGLLIHLINNKIIYKKLNIENDYDMLKRWLDTLKKIFA